MSLRLVKPAEPQPQEPVGRPPEGAPAPARRTARRVALGVIAALLLLGGAALGLSLYVARQAEGYELTLQVGARTTHVLGTNVTLTEGEAETKCVLSLLDFRALREQTAFLVDVPVVEKKTKGLPTFELALTHTEPPTMSSGALQLTQLEPIERWLILHASACIKTYVPPPAP